MSKHSVKYKHMTKSPNFCECLNEKTENYNSNNKPQISNNIRKSQILYSNNNNGKIRYGNFGNLMNANTYNNLLISDLINLLNGEDKNNNYTYTNNIINNTTQIVCDDSVLYNSNVNYNEFYNNYYQIQNIFNKINIPPKNFIFKNKY